MCVEFWQVVRFWKLARKINISALGASFLTALCFLIKSLDEWKRRIHKSRVEACSPTKALLARAFDSVFLHRSIIRSFKCHFLYRRFYLSHNVSCNDGEDNLLKTQFLHFFYQFISILFKLFFLFQN